MAIKTTTTYHTSDGKTFTDKKEAEAYEKELAIAEQCPTVIANMQGQIDSLREQIEKLWKEIVQMRVDKYGFPDVRINHHPFTKKQGTFPNGQVEPIAMLDAEPCSTYSAVNKEKRLTHHDGTVSFGNAAQDR